MSKTFRQYDSRWGKRNYNGSSTMAAAGCGPTACADVIYNLDTKITPWKTAKWMKAHGYAIYGSGTAWAGIPACLKAFGCKDVRNPQTMKEVFKIMNQYGYRAVFLFRRGTKGGVTWTTSGHYLCASKMKIKNGKHYFYMRDPGQRKHDGYFCYETQMAGLIVEVWTCYCSKINGKPLPPVKKTENKKPAKPVTPKADKIVELAKLYAYTHGTGSNKYGYPNGKPKDSYKDALKVFDPARKNWSKPARSGASCDVFVGTVIRNAGIDIGFGRGLDEQWKDLTNKKKFKEVKPSDVKPGDIITYVKRGGGGHTCICMGDRVAEAGYNHYYPRIGEKTSARTKKSNKKWIRAYRVIE